MRVGENLHSFGKLFWGIWGPNPVAPRSGPESFVLGLKKVSVRVSVTDPDMDRYKNVADGGGSDFVSHLPGPPSLQALPRHCHPTPRVMPRGVLLWCGKTCWSPSNSSTRICEPACGVSGGPFLLQTVSVIMVFLTKCTRNYPDPYRLPWFSFNSGSPGCWGPDSVNPRGDKFSEAAI